MRKSCAVVVLLFFLSGLAGAARADERLFTYTYEPATMPEGAVELEQWVTSRLGKSRGDFARFDLRTELEFGLRDNLQTALYLNSKYLRSQGVPDNGGFTNEEEFEFEGISNEWILKMLDPVADPLGLAFYVEWGAGPEELELEEKLILGKVIGRWNFALNLVVEQEWEIEQELERDTGGNVVGTERKFEKELVIELDLGVAYLFDSFALGLEFRDHNEYENMTAFEHSALFLGPVLHYRQEQWWATLSILPQIGAINPTDHGLELEEHERLEARLLVGVHF